MIKTISISQTNPDYNDLVTQFQTALATSDTWQDRLTTSTGEAITELVAAAGALNEYSVEAAFNETFPESAVRDSSLYAASQFLGVRVSRVGPASVPATLIGSSDTPVTYPPYTQFTGGGTYWFNREAFSISTTPSNVTLYQGQVISATNNGLGTAFQGFVSPENQFVVSDTDVLVSINNVSVQVSDAGLWALPVQPGVQDLTTSDGRLLLLFGNSNYGSMPLTTDSVTITYVISLGANGNNLPIDGATVQLQTDSTVNGTFGSVSSGGGAQTPAAVYKNITPALAGDYDSAVTPAQYKAKPLQYPGVFDAKTFSQREVNPMALTFMNVIQVSLLTNPVFTDSQWTDFVTWYTARTMYAPYPIRVDPVAVPITITATIYCKSYSNLQNIQNEVAAAITALYAPQQGIIGKDVQPYDINKAIEEADSNVDYAIITNPAMPILISSLNVAAPTVQTVSGSGHMGAGTYDYAISVTSTLGGSTAPANWTSVVITTTANTNTLTWPAVPNAASYQVWGRQTPNSIGLITSVAGNVTTFTDDGSISPTGLIPSESTVDIYYPSIATLSLTMAYSTRGTV